jgi:hypothetical protein
VKIAGHLTSDDVACEDGLNHFNDLWKTLRLGFTPGNAGDNFIAISRRFGAS